MAMTQPESFEPTTETCEDVQNFLEAVTDAQSWHTGETFHICRLCGEADSHADGCPVPAIRAWQEWGGVK